MMLCDRLTSINIFRNLHIIATSIRGFDLNEPWPLDHSQELDAFVEQGRYNRVGRACNI